MVTGWAALRLLGGGFFDGVGPDGSTLLEVPLLIGHRTRIASRPGVRLVRDTRMPTPIRVCGVACAPPERATYDAMRLAEDDREAVVVLDMAAAAEITSIRRVRVVRGTGRSVARAWTGSVGRCRSPVSTVVRPRRPGSGWCGCSTRASRRRSSTGRSRTGRDGWSESLTCSTSRRG